MLKSIYNEVFLKDFYDHKSVFSYEFYVKSKMSFFFLKIVVAYFCNLQLSRFISRINDAFQFKPQKITHFFKEKYPYIRAGTFVSKRIKDILTKNSYFLSLGNVCEYKKDPL